MQPTYVIITRDKCSWCDAAKAALQAKGVYFTAHNMSELDAEGYGFAKLLLSLHGINTLPQVYELRDDGKTVRIGGYTDLMTLWL